MLVASGLLPQNVAMPQWIQSGIGSFFQTPHSSPWKSYGAPHWQYLLAFKELKEKKQLDEPHKLLRAVLTDKFFHDKAWGKKVDGKKPQKEPSLKARATAWALTYYLAQKRLDGLLAYYKELSRLPRDLPFDDDAMLDCFARAFGCVDADNKRKDFELDKLANSWINAMNNEIQLDNEAQPIYEAIYKLQNELAEELANSRRRPGGIFNPGGGSGGSGPPGGGGGSFLPGGGGSGPPGGGGGSGPPGGGRPPGAGGSSPPPGTGSAPPGG